ncbi:hypothetical protein Pla144_45380 [Bythopirellula polymerisocia]|uniref:Uncharacterized protein n=1 Tax=Bythopirellula polymerisocia TaxID=2528003 RepID=A0A5C6CCL0_9BACT|nr:hypothetical protein Pla144_45380 [Bythopirellula polymerisocia]
MEISLSITSTEGVLAMLVGVCAFIVPTCMTICSIADGASSYLRRFRDGSEPSDETLGYHYCGRPSLRGSCGVDRIHDRGIHQRLIGRCLFLPLLAPLRYFRRCIFRCYPRLGVLLKSYSHAA